MGFDALGQQAGDAGGGGDGDGGRGSAIAITGGWFHTCLLDAGQMWCWGDGTSGQLGDGGNLQSDVPVQVMGLPGPATQITAAQTHSCAISMGDAYCWGDGANGRLGNGDTNPRLSPTRVSGLPAGQVTAISAGHEFTCAIAAGTGYCWGLNDTGQLGDGTGMQQLTPVPVARLPTGAAAIDAGEDHACATAGGQVYCWGHDDNGALGSGANIGSSDVAVQVVNTAAADLVTIAGWHACTLAAGAVACWGTGDNGELGDGNSASTNSPVPVLGHQTGVTAVYAAGGPADLDATCAIQNGVVSCWGLNQFGRLGDGTTQARDSPVSVVGLPGEARDVAGGMDHFCAAMVDDSVWCWGRGNSGQLGDGRGVNSLAPVQVTY